MISDFRKRYNASFSTDRYQSFLDWIGQQYQHQPPFRIAETPVFLPDDLLQHLLKACEQLSEPILRPDFKKLSQGALMAGQEVPGETDHTTFLQMDFAVCKDENGNLIPQLIEIQGFPSLYFYQDFVAKAYRQFFDVPDEVTHLFNGLTSEAYIEKLRQVIIGSSKPENVVLLEVEPQKQVTRIDFLISKAILGMENICVSDLKQEGRDLYYIKDGKKIGIEKIYNRVIFDELIKRDDLKREFYFTQEVDVNWIGHPNWFFRISKHTLPLLSGPYVPPTIFLKDLDKIPDDLENYVLKPLFSFSGSGVIINLNRFDIESISDPENYILQRKVKYESVIETTNEPAKCEIRMLMLWEPGTERPVIVNNLARLTKSLMVGVRYNKNKDWVGGSVGFFKQ